MLSLVAAGPAECWARTHHPSDRPAGGRFSQRSEASSIPRMILSAFLRVYLPADRAGGFEVHRDPAGAATVARADDHFVWQEPTVDDAFRTDWEGREYLCPRFPRLRMLEGLLAFSNAYPGAHLVPPSEVESAARELTRLRASSPVARSYILTSPWHVPLRWFSLFDPGERELYQARDGLSIRYRCTVSAGLERVDHSVEVLDEAGFDEAVIDQLRGLSDWLEGFPGEALVELDYAGVARLFSDGDLTLDESAAEVAASLDALVRHEYEEAGISYAAVATRWAKAQSLNYVN